MSSPNPLSAVSPELQNPEVALQLQMASCFGDKSTLRKLAESLPSEILDTKDYLGRTALMHSILHNNIECALILLKAGARVDITDNTGQTALHMAINKGLHHCAKVLLSRGALWNQIDLEGVTALHVAAIQPSSKCLALIMKGLNPGEVDIQDSSKKTALHWSAAYANVEHIKLLLEKGANVCIPDIEGRTPLHLAACNSSSRALSCVKILLVKEPSIINWQDYEGQTALHLSISNGTTQIVDHLTSLESCDINILDNSFCTPLHLAAQQGLTDKVALLLDRGAVHTCADGYGATAMHHAAYFNRTEAMEVFLSRSYVTDEPDCDGRNCLIWAAARKSDDVIQLMSRFNVNLSLKDKDGLTALHVAAIQGHVSTIELLISLNVPIDSKDCAGMTPLLRACEVGRYKATQVLLKNGAKISAVDNNHCTGLHWAASGGNAFLCQMLVEKGFSCNVQDDFGMTPLHYASVAGYSECVSVFLEAKANPDVVDNEGKTALHLAVMNNHLNITKLLAEHGAYLNCMALINQWVTPLDCALHNKNNEISEFLRSVGCLTGFAIESIAARKIQTWYRCVHARRGDHTYINSSGSSANEKKMRTAKEKEKISSHDVISSTFLGDHLNDNFSSQSPVIEQLKDEASFRVLPQHEQAVMIIQRAWKKFSLRKKMKAMRENIKEVFCEPYSRSQAEQLWSSSVKDFFSLM